MKEVSKQWRVLENGKERRKANKTGTNIKVLYALNVTAWGLLNSFVLF